MNAHNELRPLTKPNGRVSSDVRWLIYSVFVATLFAPATREVVSDLTPVGGASPVIEAMVLACLAIAANPFVIPVAPSILLVPLILLLTCIAVSYPVAVKISISIGGIICGIAAIVATGLSFLLANDAVGKLEWGVIAWRLASIVYGTILIVTYRSPKQGYRELTGLCGEDLESRKGSGLIVFCNRVC